jgi:CheY-like chemotaxis protein
LLLAEDNVVNQEVAAAMLRKRGHSVDIVGNGREAVDAVQRKTYDVVLMDIQMPEMDGLAATRAIRALPGGEDQRIVAITAHVSSDERERCLAGGMNGYLAKPFRSHELFALVEGWAAPPAPPAQRPAARTPVDLNSFRRAMRDAGAEDAVDGILAKFVASTPARLEALMAAARSAEAEPIQRAAHAFKSAAVTIGASTLGALLEEMETASRAGDVERARTGLEKVQRETDAVLGQLRASVKGRGA